jgi:hypothetical protein
MSLFLLQKMRYHVKLIMFLRICGSHDKTISLLGFTKYFRENFCEETKRLPCQQVVNLIRYIKHSESAITSLDYDGKGCVVISNSQGYLLFK